MRLSKANIAGLASPQQQSEMKSILAGTWPPLKPLPVFKYETVEYRATIDFDRKRGEWVCRKTSLPSNQVQELRGGLTEITMALPHGEAEMFTEEGEQQQQELEKDTNRRLQAIHDWRENSENGARYFELREFLSESQRAELDDSLRFTLTARQLQFNAKNVANVFDDLSIAGGRFATLIDFAKQINSKQRTNPQAQGEEAALEAERTNPSAWQIPALSIKDVLPEQDQASSAERRPHTASRQFETELLEIVERGSPSLVEHPRQESLHSPTLSSFTQEARTDQSFSDRVKGSFSRFLALEESKFQVALFALLLFAVMAFTVGLTLGRGPLGRRSPEASKSLVATDTKSPTLPARGAESTSRTPAPPAASSIDSAGSHRLDGATPSEEKSKESPRASDSEVRSTGSDSSQTTQSRPLAKPDISSERTGAIRSMVRNLAPKVHSNLARSRKAAGPTSSARRSRAPYRLTSTKGVARHLPGPSAILVTVPARGSQPFKVSFPKKAIAATSSFAMASQLSVLVFPEPGPTVARESTRLEAGELVSFVWPRYPRPPDRYGSAETIRVRATVGQLGQVQEVKFLSGSASLLPATIRAIHQWRYRPTLLDKRPVQAEQDVTIEFRPPQYSAQLSNHSLRN